MAKVDIENTQPLAADEKLIILEPEDTKAFMEAVKESVKEAEPVSEKESEKDDSEALATLIWGKYNDVKAQRNDLEQGWLEDIRQYRGVYSPDVIQRMHPKRSKAFIRLTRTKVKTVDSRLSDFLFPATGDKNWNIEPTPIAQFDPSMAAMLRAQYIQRAQKEPSRAELQVLLDGAARDRSEKMAKKIEDQLADLRYRDIMREVIHNGDMYGTGILKGPMVNITEATKYEKIDGSWMLQNFDNLTPFLEPVSIWDMFPDLSATKIEDCNFVIQRHKKGKHALQQLADRGDFNKSVIKTYLKDNPGGDFEDQYYDLELMSLGGVDTASSSSNDTKKYEVLEFWGYLDAEDLEQAGVEIPDDKIGSVQLAACVWVLGGKVIKACLAPMEGIKWPYFFYYYDKDETSIFGEGIPSIMRDVQELLNASFRGMLDNAAISAGPQVEVNMDLMDDLEEISEVYPFKVWVRTGQGADASSPAIRMIDVPSHTPEFLKLNEAFEKYGDEVTTIPKYMWGDNPGSGAGRTASGLSMMMGSANITIKDQVKNFDDGITKPFITAMYHWNMQFGDDDEIKGDYSIQANGSSSLIAKEVYSNSLIQFANLTANPQFAPMIKQDALLRSIVKVLDLDDKGLVKTDREIQAEKQAKAKQQQELQAFMSEITETAREYGISPKDMLTQGQSLLNQLQQSKKNAENQRKQAATRARTGNTLQGISARAS